uniref:Uncharacterized protein n=1 Tax=Chromera velia CCMP2878 TaxID=1169474 RepID=A0A0G4GH22_9ALVE|eukprot:Cvel_21893.t1-p1 / transcript=Cvel_21893.t1 / gene=Cvel_21893 / organism=Chromera_velia_CCMP2878 / gene_product=hypothetical protein / transcript_product=hypothetical protein / location=Cvel_scaffold2096:8834-10105(-) / protein_length=424 / sequence_SO=supercontig / SO=protein_coding / is_pseudo=false
MSKTEVPSVFSFGLLQSVLKQDGPKNSFGGLVNDTAGGRELNKENATGFNALAFGSCASLTSGSGMQNTDADVSATGTGLSLFASPFPQRRNRSTGADTTMGEGSSKLPGDSPMKADMPAGSSPHGIFFDCLSPSRFLNPTLLPKYTGTPFAGGEKGGKEERESPWLTEDSPFGSARSTQRRAGGGRRGTPHPMKRTATQRKEAAGLCVGSQTQSVSVSAELPSESVPPFPPHPSASPAAPVWNPEGAEGFGPVISGLPHLSSRKDQPSREGGGARKCRSVRFADSVSCRFFDKDTRQTVRNLVYPLNEHQDQIRGRIPLPKDSEILLERKIVRVKREPLKLLQLQQEEAHSATVKNGNPETDIPSVSDSCASAGAGKQIVYGAPSVPPSNFNLPTPPPRRKAGDKNSKGQVIPWVPPTLANRP